MDAAIIYVLILAGILVVGYARSRGRAMRRLAAEPVVPIAQVGDDQRCRITGHVLGPFGHPVLTAPLTGRPCVYYEAIVEERYQTKNGTRWAEVLREMVAVPFVIQDATGRAVVDPYRHAGVLLAQESAGQTHGAGTSAAQQALLDRHGTKTKGWVFDKTLRYREGVISVGEVVTVLGQGVRDVDPHAPAPDDYRGPRPTLLHLAGAPERPLVISDDPAATTSAGAPAAPPPPPSPPA